MPSMSSLADLLHWADSHRVVAVIDYAALAGHPLFCQDRAEWKTHQWQEEG